jgi:hypothetical protein
LALMLLPPLLAPLLPLPPVGASCQLPPATAPLICCQLPPLQHSPPLSSCRLLPPVPAPSIHLSPLVSCCQLAPSHLPPSTPLPLLPAYACWHQVTQLSPPGVPLLLPTTHCSSNTINIIPYPHPAPPLHFTLLPPALCTPHSCLLLTLGSSRRLILPQRAMHPLL